MAFKAFNLVEQTVRLMATEGLQLAFTPCGIEEIASVAEQVRPTMPTTTRWLAGDQARRALRAVVLVVVLWMHDQSPPDQPCESGHRGSPAAHRHVQVEREPAS